MKHTYLVVAGALLGSPACAPDARSPLSAAFEPDTPAAAVGLARASTSETHAKRLTAVIGDGAGIVNVTPTAADDGTFAAQIEVNAHGLPPETTFSVERSPDLVPDGVCTNPAWVPFGVTFTTSAGGAGAAHIDFHRGAPFLSGVSFDVRFRVVGPGAELQTGCFTVTVK